MYIAGWHLYSTPSPLINRSVSTADPHSPAAEANFGQQVWSPPADTGNLHLPSGDSD